MTFSNRRLGLVLGINQTVSWGTTFYLPAVIARPASDNLGTTGAALLGAFSCALLMTGFCAPRVGRWIDRRGGRGMLASSVLVMASGQLLLACSADLASWYLAWAVLGIGMALGLYDAAFAVAGTLLGRDAGPVITGITLLAGFASTVFWSLGAGLIGTVGWRGLLLCYAGVMLLVNLPLVWFLVPGGASPGQTARAQSGTDTPPQASRLAAACLGGFFTIRWFITSGIAVNILTLLHGLGLSETTSVVVAGLIGPGQVLGRIVEWSVAPRLGLLARARGGAMLFPIGALALLSSGPWAAAAFALLYGMSNGILTINRGTLPLAIFGPRGYAVLLGWLAVPVLLAQAVAPTLVAPVIGHVPALTLLLVAGGLAGLAGLLLLPLHVPG